MSTAGVMTYQQARALLKKLIEAKNKDELQQLISSNISACDGVFFAELESLIQQFQARGDEASAQKLKALGDYMARLRFMI
jgi:hypothetical protein